MNKRKQVYPIERQSTKQQQGTGKATLRKPTTVKSAPAQMSRENERKAHDAELPQTEALLVELEEGLDKGSGGNAAALQDLDSNAEDSSHHPFPVHQKKSYRKSSRRSNANAKQKVSFADAREEDARHGSATSRHGSATSSRQLAAQHQWTRLPRVQRMKQQMRRASNVMHRQNTAEGQVEKRHLEEMCHALEIEFHAEHLHFQRIPVKNNRGVYVDWPYRIAILYHQQGETLESFKETLMRYEESYFLITALLMTIGFGLLVISSHDYWDKEEDAYWSNFVAKQIYMIASLSSSLCAFRSCMVFTGWYLAISDTPADLVPVVICRFLVEYQTGRCAHGRLLRILLGGVLPTDLLYSSLAFLVTAAICAAYLLHGTTCALLLLGVSLVYWKPLREAAYEPYPIHSNRPGTYAAALQWAIDNEYNVEVDAASMWHNAYDGVREETNRSPVSPTQTGNTAVPAAGANSKEG